MPAATLFPTDDATWIVVGLLLLLVIYNGGVNLSLPTLAAIGFVGYIAVVGTTQNAH